MVEPNSEVKIETRRKTGARPLLVFLLVVFCVVIAAVIAGTLPRLTKQKALLAASDESAARKPVVMASPAKFAPARSTVDLPGDLQAQIESPIFARADGYLKERRAELGDHVKAGDVMAVIEMPEIDQQILQARASLAQSQAALKELEADIELAKANANLAKVTTDRWERLSQKGVVSKQDRDEKNADYEVKKAQADRAVASLATAREVVNSAQANVHRMEEMKNFGTVTAPFDGIVTAREIDVGWLISAGSGSLTSKEMFRVAKITPMRIFVNVPQAYSSVIFDGQTAELRVQERPGKVYPAKVSHSSHEIDMGSRSMLSILVTPNEKGELLPGMYAQVRFTMANAKPLLRVPGDAVMTTKSGAHVAIVDDSHVVHFRNVVLGQDLGSEVEIVSGLHEGDMVVSNPADAVQEGAVVDVRAK